MQSRADNGEQALPDLLTQQEALSPERETFSINSACFMALITMQISSGFQE